MVEILSHGHRVEIAKDGSVVLVDLKTDVMQEYHSLLEAYEAMTARAAA